MLDKIFPYLKYIKIAGILILIIGVYFYGHNNGESHVYAEWNKSKLADAKETKRLEHKLVVKTAEHNEEMGRISNELSKSKNDHAVFVANLRHESDVRLRQSEERAKIYQRHAQVASGECGNLASYAAGLDRSLEQGRLLVKEFGSAITERDRQLRLLGDQILNDRKLVNN